AVLSSARARSGPRSGAILAVHMLGPPCDMHPLLRLAAEKNIPVVEDASQAQGAVYKGERAAGLGRITPMSLGPVKNLACYGDGGVVLTNDDRLAEAVRPLRVPRQAGKEKHQNYCWENRLPPPPAGARPRQTSPPPPPH